MTKTDEAMQMLDQLETMMGACERHHDNMPTMRSFLMVALNMAIALLT